MNKDPKVYIDHITESIELLEEYFDNVDEINFKSSKKLQDLACRRLEIIGEAVKYLPEDFKDKYKYITWKSIAGLRDILIHQYFGIDLVLLWNVIKNDIPELKENLLHIYENENW